MVREVGDVALNSPNCPDCDSSTKLRNCFLCEGTGRGLGESPCVRCEGGGSYYECEVDSTHQRIYPGFGSRQTCPECAGTGRVRLESGPRVTGGQKASKVTVLSCSRCGGAGWSVEKAQPMLHL